ncbi:hypothetical protein BDV93DRAFT_413352, partial [Ceratobasidium sp. AG-I]
SCIAGDAGPAVAKTKKTINEKYPWILRVWDPCHQLNRGASDIVVVAGLSEAKTILSFFHRNYLAAYKLDKSLKDHKISRTLEAFSETRFVISYHAGNSVLRCMPALQDVSYTHVFQTQLQTLLHPKHNHRFVSKLHDAMDILRPWSHAVTMLEGQHVSCADVFDAWIGLSLSMRDLLSDSSTSFFHHRNAIIAKCNSRFDQFMKESSSKMFLLAFWLRP